MHNILVLFACIGAVLCNDLEVGTKSGRVLFDEKIEASPAIWKQTQNVTINATEHEVISCIKVTDERENKDGSARIVEGGEGQKNVTIELQSPAVFRGFTFHVVVYAVQENGQKEIVQQELGQQETGQKEIGQQEFGSQQETGQKEIGQQEFGQQPISITKDTDVNQAATTTKGSDIMGNVPTVPSTSAKPLEEKTNQDRKNRDTQSVIDPIVDYVNFKASTVPPFKSEQTTAQIPEIKDYYHPHDVTKEIHSDGKMTTEQVSTTGQTETAITDVTTGSTDTPATNDYTHTYTPATKVNEYSQAESTTTKVNDHEFDSISKEIGQKVVFGIKQH